MNDEELAALAEKLLGQGLSDDEIVEHLTRAKHGGAVPEEGESNATTPLEAGAMHAFDAIDSALLDIGSGPGEFSGYQGGAGGRQMLSEEDREKRQSKAEERKEALAIADEEHPVASKVGTWGTLALPIVGMGPKGIAAAGKLGARGGGRLLDVAKGIMSEAPIVGRRGMVGRPVRAGIKAWQKGAKVPDAPSVQPKSGAWENPPSGSFPAIEGTGDGVSTFGMSAGEARAVNAPKAHAREMTGQLARVKEEITPDFGRLQRIPKEGPLSKARDQAHRPYGAGPEGGMETYAPPGRRSEQIPIDTRYAETILGETKGPAGKSPLKRAREIINPRSGKAVTEGEVQGVIDREAKINQTVKDRKQKSRPFVPEKYTPATRGGPANQFPEMSVEQIQARIALDNGPTELLKRELARRTQGTVPGRSLP